MAPQNGSDEPVKPAPSGAAAAAAVQSPIEFSANPVAQNWYENAICILRNSGCKLTEQRRLILLLFEHGPGHLTAQQVFESVTRSQPDISLVTVYRTLELLKDVGVLSKINFNDGADRYERNLGNAGHHHHLICTGCGRVVEFGDCEISSLARKLEQATGFTIDSHWLKLTGQCATCRLAAPASTPGTNKEE